MRKDKILSAVFILAIGLMACSEDDNNSEIKDNESEKKDFSVSLDEISEEEGVFGIKGDVELVGSGTAVHYYNFVKEEDEIKWSVHTVKIEDAENEVVVTIDFYLIDPEASAYGGKLPESGVYKVYEPGLTTPEDDYAKVNVYGDGLNSYFTTVEESELDLTVGNDEVWEASFSNELDDYETEEAITLQCAFKAPAEE
ncbi:MAG: hypothetical protein ACQEQ0_05265 [Bacteroidota bacterium]